MKIKIELPDDGHGNAEATPHLPNAPRSPASDRFIAGASPLSGTDQTLEHPDEYETAYVPGDRVSTAEMRTKRASIGSGAVNRPLQQSLTNKTGKIKLSR